MSVIISASSLPIVTVSGMPDVSDALMDWFQQITFTNIAKIVNGIFQVSETPTSYSFLGTWQPAQPTQLEMMTQGQRSWKWWSMHAQVGIPLAADDVISYLGVQYRVMSINDYTLNGYLEYRLVNDFTGSGPPS